LEDCKKYWEESLIPKYEEDTFEDINFSSSGGLLASVMKDNLRYFFLILTRGVDRGVIVHECFHLIMEIAEDRGTFWNNYTDEWYAYCLEDAYRQVEKIWLT